MSEQYGQWQTSKCGHAAFKIDVSTMEDVEEGRDPDFLITARNCKRYPTRPLTILVCATCSTTVDVFDPGLCEVVDEQGRQLPLAKEAAQ